MIIQKCKTFIYILKLENGKYYVGKTKNLAKRIQQHKEGKNGAVWTKMYAVMEVLDSFEEKNEFDEDLYTKMYMAKYGLNNVRGGSYVQIDLTDEQIELIQKEIWQAQNRCSNCGGTHFIKYCPQYKEELFCERCFRDTHNVKDCFAKKTFMGNELK